MFKTMLLTLFSIAFAQAWLAEAQEIINLTLQDAKAIALENNRDIQIEKQTLKISQGDILTQEGIFDPILNLSSSFTDAQDPTASTFIQSGAINQEEFNAESGVTGNLPTGTFYNLLNFSVTRTTTDSPIDTLSPNWFTSLSFSVGQELLKNFGLEVNQAPIIVAKRSSKISEKELEIRISDVLLNVERAYWILVAAKENLDLTKTALELARDLQRRNEIQVEVGTLAPVTVTQAKSEVAGRQVDLISAENILKATADNLKNILVIPLTQEINPTDEPTTSVKKFDEKQVVTEALKERPEIIQAELDIKNKETQKKFFSNQRLPRLAVEGTVNLQGLGGRDNPNRLVFGDGDVQPISELFNDSYRDSFRNLIEREFPTWQILGVFSFPIFNRTARGDYIKASADLDRSVISYKRVTDNVALDVRDAIREVESSLRTIEAARTATQLQEEVLNNEEERLKVGIGTTRDVLEAQRDLVNARTQEIRAIADYNIALSQLERARGTILEASGVEIKE